MKGNDSAMKSKLPILFMPTTNQDEYRDASEKEYSLYFHFPFCVDKCSFCSIKTIACNGIDFELYLDAMLCELIKYKSILNSQKISSIHFGGGTPSLLSVYEIEKIVKAILACLKDRDDVEIVFESHPSSLSYEKINCLSQFPKVTLNLGIQTFDSHQLSLINRFPQREDMIDKLVYAKQKDFYAVGIDIIAGLPGSSIQSVLDDITIAVELELDHISLYPLRIEKESTLYEKPENYIIPKKVECIEMIEFAKYYLQENGYFPRSIFCWSNNEKDTYRYSTNQMKGNEWIGIGAGAYTYLEKKIYLNHIHVDCYIKSSMNNNITYCSMETQNTTANIIWEISFLLRKGNIDYDFLKNKYGDLIKPYIDRIITLLCELGYAFYDDDNNMLTITTRGIVNFDQIENIINKEALEIYGQN